MAVVSMINITVANTARPINSIRQPIIGSRTTPIVEPLAAPPAIAPNSQPRGAYRSSKQYNRPVNATEIGIKPFVPTPVKKRHRISSFTFEIVEVKKVKSAVK